MGLGLIKFGTISSKKRIYWEMQLFANIRDLSDGLKIFNLNINYDDIVVSCKKENTDENMINNIKQLSQNENMKNESSNNNNIEEIVFNNNLDSIEGNIFENSDTPYGVANMTSGTNSHDRIQQAMLDAISYGQFNVSNIEHGIVFDNTTLFGDIIYNLTTGLRQNRILTRGTKSAEWNGTMDAQGFILNQDNILEWQQNVKYTKGTIVKYKNRYYTAIKIIQPALLFQEKDWVVSVFKTGEEPKRHLKITNSFNNLREKKRALPAFFVSDQCWNQPLLIPSISSMLTPVVEYPPSW